MPDFSFENQGSMTYLVYTISEYDSIDTMSLGMLTNNKIPGLAQTLFTQLDDRKFIKYNISAKVTASDFFMGAINRRRLLGVFNSIVDAILGAEEYMIDSSMVLLDLNYIFTDVSTCEAKMICLPVVRPDVPAANYGAFFKDIMFNHQFDQSENCDYVTQIINYLNSTPVFSLYDFKNLLNHLSHSEQGERNPQPSAIRTAAPTVQPSVPQSGNRTMASVAAPQFQPQGQENRPVPQRPSGAVPQYDAGKARAFQEVFVNQKPMAQIPPKAPAVPSAPVQPMQQTPENTITLFHLLSHYNKENAAAYKAQKEARKNGNMAAVQGQPVPPKQNTRNTNAPAMGFAIPGQAAVPQAPQSVSIKNGKKPQPNIAVPPNGPSAAQPANASMQPAYASTPAQSATQSAYAPVQPAYAPMQQPQPMQSMNFGETTVLNAASGETTVLNAVQPCAQNPAPQLVRLKNNERIPLNKPVFRIGKERSYVDYFVGDNPAISRSHANIITRDGAYFIVDTNSTNHTYVNGMLIQSNVETKLSHGDKIRLANEEFEFKLY